MVWACRVHISFKFSTVLVPFIKLKLSLFILCIKDPTLYNLIEGIFLLRVGLYYIEYAAIVPILIFAKLFFKFLRNDKNFKISL